MTRHGRDNGSIELWQKSDMLHKWRRPHQALSSHQVVSFLLSKMMPAELNHAVCEQKRTFVKPAVHAMKAWRSHLESTSSDILTLVTDHNPSIHLQKASTQDLGSGPNVIDLLKQPQIYSDRFIGPGRTFDWCLLQMDVRFVISHQGRQAATYIFKGAPSGFHGMHCGQTFPAQTQCYRAQLAASVWFKSNRPRDGHMVSMGTRPTCSTIEAAPAGPVLRSAPPPAVLAAASTLPNSASWAADLGLLGVPALATAAGKRKPQPAAYWMTLTKLAATCTCIQRTALEKGEGGGGGGASWITITRLAPTSSCT